MDRVLSGKIALVTGAASGIGRAVAEAFAREGARVIATDIDTLDVTREEDWDRAMASADGRIDILVNNAGIVSGDEIAETKLSDWRRLMAVNLDGVFLGTRAGLRQMKKQEPAGGLIVNIASVTGIKPLAGAAAYGSAKAAVRHLTKCAALEGARHGIRVNSVSPGGVKTAIWEGTKMFADLVATEGSREGAFAAMGAGAPIPRFAEPEEIAAAVLYLARPEAAFMTGADLVIDGGFSI
ncbi:MAG: SDR family oxidoreductase [Bryobacteraceae bacterium]|nr:SDR family oxidoreductase [Bryobacteraceae bacterium]